MEVDKEKQARALAKAKQSLLQAEIKREEARLSQNVERFLKGKYDALLNDEFTEHLAPHIIRLYRGDQRKSAIALLEQLEQSVCNKKPPIRERSLIVILILSEHIYNNSIRELSSIIARITSGWLAFESEFIAGFEPVCLQLQKIIVEMLATEQWYEVEDLIVLLNRISSKSLKKNNLIHGVVARMQENLADPEALDILVKAYLEELSQRRDVAETILLNLGRSGSQYLVQKLIHSNDKDERLALIDLIPRLGEVSVPVVTGYLAEDQPWFVIRNIIMIISRLGDNALYQSVSSYLSHPDIRVQQQVINCIEVLGGDQMRGRLIEALSLISDELKAPLIDQLIQFDGSDIETALLDLLEQHQMFSSHTHDFLVAKLCGKVVSYPSPRTVNILLDLIENRKQRYGSSDSIVRAASDSLHTIEQNTSDAARNAYQPGGASQPGRDESAMLEQEVLAQIPADPSQMGEAFADGGLSDIFVATLTDAPSTQDESENESSPDRGTASYHSQDHHLLVWSGFYEQLTTDEVNGFFSILRPATLAAGDYIVEQGSSTTTLYFIDNGFADISHGDDSENCVMAPLQAGELIGSEGFFDNLNWSVTLQAQTELQVRLLEQEDFLKLVETQPGLKDKLASYCRRFDLMPYLLRAADSGNDGEESTELVIHSASVTLTDKLDGEQRLSGRLHQRMSGGFNFSVPRLDLETLTSWIGHQASVEIEASDGPHQRCFGIISGGGTHDSADDISVFQVKLYHPLEQEDYRCRSIEIL